MRSTQPLSLVGALSSDPMALAAQSRCDRGGQCHGSGWGIAAYNGEARVLRSTQPAYADRAYADATSMLTATLALAHVRQASVGTPALENTHPFVHGRWVFAHNGTLQGFAEKKARLIEATPGDLRSQIRGATDSEHAFYFWLGRLRAIVGDANGDVTVDDLRRSLAEVVHLIAEWFPTNEEETKLNFLVTNGTLLAATRWQHSLWMLDESETSSGDKPSKVLIASEPTNSDNWLEVPDRSLVIVDDQLGVHASSLVQAA